MNTIISPKEEKEKFCLDRGDMKMPARRAEETGISEEVRQKRIRAQLPPDP
jgi:hypothetical protein